MMKIDPEKLEEFQNFMAEVRSLGNSRDEKLSIWMELLSERRSKLLLHKLNSLESNFLSAINSLQGLQKQKPIEKKRKKHWYNRRKE